MDSYNFESALKRLEEIVGLIENGKLELDQAVELFEEGMKLSVFCQKELKKAESKVKKLIVDADTGEFNLLEGLSANE